MIIIQWCKTQITCLLILAYIGIYFLIEGKNLNRITKKAYCNKIYDILFVVTEIAVLFDGITACTVNFLDSVSKVLNLLLHLGMFVSYEIFVALLFLYWTSVTVGIPKNKYIKAAYVLPCIVSVILTVLFLPSLDFIQGKYTNYSMGNSVYVCFTSVIIYCVLTVAVIITKYRYIPGNKRKNIYTSLVFIIVIMFLQIVFPESLISCIAATMTIISIFMNMENPTIHGLEHYHSEMVMGFATLVENKDDNTGGHIRRSSAYASLIAQNLRKNKKYKNMITRDYLYNLAQSAPMHDIGKIGIPDAILQKPGKLSNEEFDKMKEHPIIGGKIIKDTFGHLFNG